MERKKRRKARLTHKLYWAALLGLAACGGASQEAGFQEACFEGIKRRLMAPTTFEVSRVTPNHSDLPLRPTEQIREALSNAEDGSLEEIDLMLELSNTQSGKYDHRAVKYHSYVEYDAQNEMGVPIRDLAECEYEARPDEEISAEDGDDISVNGLTYLDWLLSQMK